MVRGCYGCKACEVRVVWHKLGMDISQKNEMERNGQLMCQSKLVGVFQSVAGSPGRYTARQWDVMFIDTSPKTIKNVI